ncbi:MAG: hypothetical protein GX465_16880 [Acidobacteria bacterium]|nr:hypothetical protein [Acidobacteriota bacterium]
MRTTKIYNKFFLGLSMPIKECTENKKPGWKYGDSGKCYTVDDPEDEKALLEAKKKAIKQAIAIRGSEAHLNEAYRKAAQIIFNTHVKLFRRNY